MRGDLTPAVAAVLDACDRPSLVFELARIEANARAIAEAAREIGITVLFAAKSFPRPEVRAIAARWFDGFDVASAAEAEAAGAARIVSVADPTGRAVAAVAAAAGRVIAGCETIDQVRAAPARAELALRLSASLTGRDPAVGAVQDGSGHRRSRFGLDVEAARRRTVIAELIAAAAGRPIGLHVHHGAVAATGGERFVATARAALAIADEAGLVPRFLDVGGAWHAVGDLPRALRELRAAVPAAIELIIEPGRVVADGAGFACGRVAVARELDDRPLRVVELSRICHLRWSHVELVGRSPQPDARQTLFVGPTCFEDDTLGEWTVPPPPVGARIAVRNVSGYAVAWNTGFGGVPPADVVMI